MSSCSSCSYRNCVKSRHRLVSIGFASFHRKERASGGDSLRQREELHERRSRGARCFFGLNHGRIHSSLRQKNIKWCFNPPYGSHFNGIWERCIRTARKILQALLREQVTDDESLSPVICEVKSRMNSRPITVVSSDPNDSEPLTPNHLLLLKSETWFCSGKKICCRVVVRGKHNT